MARFRQTHEIELAKLFTQVLRLCAEAGLVKVGVVALDGTKIKAHAALASDRTVETITTEVSRMLTEAQVTDAAEDPAVWPGAVRRRRPAEGLRDRQSRLARLQACQERLTQEAATATAQQQAKIETRQAEEAATGQKKQRPQTKGARGGRGPRRQGECDGPGQSHREETQAGLCARLQCTSGGDGGPDHRGS